MKKTILIVLLSLTTLYSQNTDPNKLITKVREKFKKVQDYEVDAKIKVDVDFIKVPDMTAKIYFKQPDKVKMNTEGFAMVPKQAFSFSPEKLFSNNYNAIFVKSDKLNNIPVSVIKVIPSDENSEVVLSTLWIDTEKDVIRKIETTPKKGGSFQIEFSYDKNINYPLPSYIKFNFEVPKFNMPRNMRNGADKETQQTIKQQQGPEKGTVSISYSNYKINKGIPDSFFAEKKDQKK